MWLKLPCGESQGESRIHTNVNIRLMRLTRGPESAKKRKEKRQEQKNI